MSYSVYLLHPLFLDAYDSLPFAPGFRQPIWLQVGAAAVFLAVLLACCAGTYYLLEAPMQRVGRRVAARLDARFGPDRDARTPGSAQQQAGGQLQVIAHVVR